MESLSAVLFLALFVGIICGAVFCAILVFKKMANKQKQSEVEKPLWLNENIQEQVIISGRKNKYVLLFFPILTMAVIFAVISGFWFAFSVVAGLTLYASIIFGIIYLSYGKTEIIVTTHRIYGAIRFGKRVDLPVDSITAVGTSKFRGIDVSTPSGWIRFKFIDNNTEILTEINNLIQNRQTKPYAFSQNNVSNVSTGCADEIKKYKDLLDSGVITQEEFETKKKQLLDL